MPTPTANSGKGPVGVPGNVIGLTKVSNYPARDISAATYEAAKAALNADPLNGHRQAY